MIFLRKRIKVIDYKFKLINLKWKIREFWKKLKHLGVLIKNDRIQR